VSLLWFSESALARQIEGRLTTTLTIMEDSVLVGDVTCAMENSACIVFGAPNLTLDLDGFVITGLANPETGCQGTSTGAEVGILVNGQNGAVIRGPGVIRYMRNFGISVANSNGGKISGVTVSTTCMSGIFLVGSSGYEVEGNVSVRNGNLVNPCGGI
jgi:hypothetical protein